MLVDLTLTIEQYTDYLPFTIAQLERENYLLKMERDLLKKVEELERRDACLK